MDKRTETEKMLDRFLEGWHPRLTPMQEYMFKDITRKFKKWNDRERSLHRFDDFVAICKEFEQYERQPKEEHMKADKGLYDKFSVTRNLNGEQVHGTFVLMPEKDPAAVAALATYADNVRKEAPKLSDDIWRWLTRIELDKAIAKQYPPIPDWAKDFFAHGMRSTTNGSGQDLVLIEAGPGRGKTTLGITAGIQYWESNATPLEQTLLKSTHMGIIVTLSFGQGRDVVMPLLVDKFRGTVTRRDPDIVSIPTKIGSCTIRICAIDSPVLEGLHLHADWLFVDNIDLMRPQLKVWRVADRLDPKMFIVSQSVHTFASSILANKNEWNVLTDPTLL